MTSMIYGYTLKRLIELRQKKKRKNHQRSWFRKKNRNKNSL